MKIILYLSLLFINCCVYAQDKTSVIFYNVENLFDTINDPKTDDEEYLPSSEKKWNSEKYKAKIDHIHEVMGQFSSIGIMGVCEIENKAVLKDVVKGQNQKLKIVHIESPDARGIDVGLFYNKNIFRLKKKGKLRYIIEVKGEKKATRDILFVELKKGKERIHVLVNHWPSRSGGEMETESARLVAAQMARNYIDSVLAIHPKAKIILMGDLNDYPTNKSVQSIAEKMSPMITSESGSKGGSHSYNNQWHVLDHIFVSESLKESNGIRTVLNSGKINEFPFLFETYKGNVVTFRTYAGKNYLGGYSDHLPVSIELVF
jgi:predicted extracellular nuclease